MGLKNYRQLSWFPTLNEVLAFYGDWGISLFRKRLHLQRKKRQSNHLFHFRIIFQFKLSYITFLTGPLLMLMVSESRPRLRAGEMMRGLAVGALIPWNDSPLFPVRFRPRGLSLLPGWVKSDVPSEVHVQSHIVSHFLHSSSCLRRSHHGIPYCTRINRCRLDPRGLVGKTLGEC